MPLTREIFLMPHKSKIELHSSLEDEDAAQNDSCVGYVA